MTLYNAAPWRADAHNTERVRCKGKKERKKEGRAQDLVVLGKFKLRVVGHRLQLRLERAVLRLERVLGAAHGTQGSAGYVRAPTRCEQGQRMCAHGTAATCCPN
jgi:hypothetical protein